MSCIRYVMCLGDADAAARRAARRRETSALERLRGANSLLLRRAEHLRGRIGAVERELYELQVERRLSALRTHAGARMRALRADELARVRRLLDARRAHTGDAVRCERQSTALLRAINELAGASLQREVVESLRDGAALASDAVRRLADDVDIDALVESLADARDEQARVDEALAGMAAADVDDAALAAELERLEADERLAERVGEPRVDAAAAAALEQDARELAAATESRVRARVALAEEV